MTSPAPFSPPAPNIVCRQVEVQFGLGHRVLDQLDFEVEPGEIVALVGPSGCGKSTLLRSIAGLQPIERGRIEIAGQSSSYARGQMSFVFQDAALMPWRTVEQNIRLPLELQHENWQTRRKEILELLATVGLDAADAKKLPKQLSGGMKMRTSLARALVTDPNLILLDEPFAALDDMLRMKLNELLLKLWTERRRTMVFVTHNIAEAIYLSQRIAIMQRGKIAKWIEIPLSMPREQNVRSSVEFAKIYATVSGSISETAA